MKLLFKRCLATMMALTLLNGMVLDSAINIFASDNDSQFNNVDLLIYRTDLCVAEDTVCNRAINSIMTCDNPTKVLVDSAKSNSGFEEGVAAWKILHVPTNPSQVADDVIDEKGYYEALILSLFISQTTSENYSTKITKQVVSDANKILSATKTLVNGSDELDRLLVSTHSYIHTVPLEEQLKLREYLQSSFETAHPTLAASTEAVSVVKDIVDSAKTVEEAITRMANYGSLCELGDSTKNVITAMYNECSSGNLTLKSALLETSMSVEDFNAGIKATILNATEEQMVSLTGTAIDEGWNWVINLNPSVKAFMAGAKLGTFVGDTVCNALLSTDKTIEQYFKMTCLLEIDKVAKSVLRQMENNYKSDRTNLNAQNYLEAIETVFKISYLSCDLAEEFAKIIYVDSTAGWLVSILSKEGFGKYDKFVKQVRSIKNSFTSLHDSLWTNYLNNLEVDYPEIYKELMGIVDPVPVTGISFNSTEMNIVNDESYFPMIETPIVSPSNATNKKVTYESSDNSILHIDPEGGWMFPNKVGSVTVTATTEDGGFSASIVINVEDKVVEEETYDPLEDYDYFKLANDSITIARYKGSDQFVIIPKYATVDDNIYPVRSISDEAFLSSDVVSVVIPDGVTTIGRNAFDGCSSLSSVIIPDSVTWIRDDAFRGCSSLSSVIIPESISRMGSNVFSECSSLSSVTILDGVTDIGSGTFSGCSSLENIIIPDSVTSIGTWAFSECSSLTNIKIPFGITQILDSTFAYCTSLTHIEIPASVVKIDFFAFGDCSSLKNIKIPDGITDIDSYTFSGCSSLKNIIIPNSVIRIGESAFKECSSLSSVTIPDDVTSIGEAAFKGCSSLSSVTIPNGVTSIGQDTFRGCSSLSSVTIPDGVTRIGSGAFWGCSSLTNIKIPLGIKQIEASTFIDCTNLTFIEIPYSVDSIGEFAFYHCSSLMEVILPESMRKISDSAFRDCSSLKRIRIPDGITEIYYQTFDGCSNLESIIIPNSVMCIGEDAFRRCSSLSSVTIPDGVTSIRESAFSECKNLADVRMSNSVTSIERRAFSKCSSLSNITIPDGVASIEESTFSGCSSLVSVTIPDGVTSIGESAFSGCENLINVSMSNNVIQIGSGAFSYCSNLESITIPDGVTSIGSYAFSGCKNLTNVSMSNSVIQIGAGAFSYCSGLESIIIPDGVTSIEWATFNECFCLKYIVLPDSVISIDERAFPRGYYGYNVTIICLPNSYAEEYAKSHNIKYMYGQSLPEEGINLSAATVVLSDDSFIYNGYLQLPSVISVTVNGEMVPSDKYIVLANSADNGNASAGINAGTVTLTIESKDASGYVGSVDKTYEIVKADASITLGNLTQVEGNVVPVTAHLSPSSSDAEVRIEYFITKSDGTKGWTTVVPQGQGSYQVRAYLASEKSGRNLNGYSSFQEAKENGRYAEGIFVIQKNTSTGGDGNTENGGTGSGSGSGTSSGSGSGSGSGSSTSSGSSGVSGGSGSQSQGNGMESNQENSSDNGSSVDKGNTETINNPDGSTTIVTNEIKEDGTTVQTETTTRKDGTKQVSVIEIKTNGSSKVTTTLYDNVENITSVVEKTSLQSIENGKDAVITVKRDGDGKVTSAKASVNIFGKGGKSTIDGDIVKELTNTAGIDIDITMTVKDSKGNTLYKLVANSNDLEIGNSLKVFKYSAKKGYVFVNEKTYNVSDSGNVSISLKDKATYRLKDVKTAAKIEKQILISLKPAKASVKLKNGKSIKVALANTFNSENAKSIIFSTTDKKIVKVSKTGKVKALMRGTAIVNAKVVLKNGKTKIIKTKVTVQ